MVVTLRKLMPRHGLHCHLIFGCECNAMDCAGYLMSDVCHFFFALEFSSGAQEKKQWA